MSHSITHLPTQGDFARVLEASSRQDSSSDSSERGLAWKRAFEKATEVDLSTWFPALAPKTSHPEPSLGESIPTHTLLTCRGPIAQGAMLSLTRTDVPLSVQGEASYSEGTQGPISGSINSWDGAQESGTLGAALVQGLSDNAETSPISLPKERPMIYGGVRIGFENPVPVPANDSFGEALWGETDTVSKETLPPRVPGDSEFRDSIRTHAEWTSEGVRVWLGVDADQRGSLPELVQQVQQWLALSGESLYSLVCNGQTLWEKDGDCLGEAADRLSAPEAPETGMSQDISTLDSMMQTRRSHVG